MEGSQWDEQVRQDTQELEGQLLSVIKSQREREMDKMHRITTKATFETIEEIVNPPVYELKPDFWVDIRDPYVTEIMQVLLNCKQILHQGFQVNLVEEQDFMDKFEAEIREYTSSYIKKLFKDINVNLLRRFNNMFKNDKTGSQRNWVAMEEKQIRDLWAMCKQDIEPIFNSFKYIEIPNDLSSKVVKSEAETPGVELDSIMKEDFIPKSSSSINFRSNSMMYAKLLTEADINRVRDKFYEDANIQLEEAIRKHQNVSMGGTPLWLYIVLVYFAYDDIFRMLANPLLFYPIMLVSSIIGMLYSMGLGPIMVPAIKQTVNLGFRQAGIPYQI